MTALFLRNDDVGDRTPALEAVSGILTELAMPVSHQVIPSRLTDTGVAFLLDRKHAAPDGVFLHQHGYKHEQMVDGEQRWTEFAGGRPYRDQLEAIEAGRALMGRRLGDAVGAEVFTPPSHKYDENTVRALQESGFRVLSAAFYTAARARAYYALGRATRSVTMLGHRVSHHGRTIPGTTLVEVSISIDLDAAAAAPGSGEAVAAFRSDLQRARRYTDLVGVMMHHERFGDAARLANLRAVLEDVRTDPQLELTTLEAAAAGLTRA
jgi:hypothetical protein